MTKMRLDVSDMFDRLTIEKSCNGSYQMKMFGSVYSYDDDDDVPTKFSDSPKAAFLIMPEDMRSFIEKVKDDLEVKA